MSATGGPRREDAAFVPDSIAKNTAFSYATQLTTASLTALLTVFLVRELGPRSYGLFALALSVSTIALPVADAGISASSARFIAEHRDQRAEVGALFVDVLKLKFVVSAAVFVALVLLASPIARVYGEPGLVWPLRGIAVAMFGQSCVLMLLTVTNALGRMVVNLRLVAIESVLEVAASVSLVLLGAGAAGAAFGRAIGYGLGAVIGLILVLWLVGHPPLLLSHLPNRSTVRRVGIYAGAVFIVDSAYFFSSSVNVLLLGGFLGTAASGIFQATWRLIAFLGYVGLSVAYGVAPRLARSPGHEPNVGALRAALRGLIAFQCVLLAPAVIWARPITHLVLGSGYGGAAGVLAALAPFIFFSGLAPILSLSINYFGEARRRVPIALTTLVLVFVASMVLIPRHGLVGAAVATDIGYGYYTLAHLWLCHRLLKLPLAQLGWALACALTAAAAMGIVLFEFGTTDLSPRDWLLGATGGLAAYVCMLVFTGEIRGRDLARASAAVRKPLARIRRLPATARPPQRAGATSSAAVEAVSPAPRIPRTAPPPEWLGGTASRTAPADSPGRRRPPDARAQKRAEGAGPPAVRAGSPPGRLSPADRPPEWVAGRPPPAARAGSPPGRLSPADRPPQWVAGPTPPAARADSPPGRLSPADRPPQSVAGPTPPAPRADSPPGRWSPADRPPEWVAGPTPPAPRADSPPGRLSPADRPPE
jgi:O-antigen/teichoic acid export membrane protein